MAGCDGWVTIKVFELIFSVFCIIFKRVTDDEANKLFYFLQKVSREWPLLNNVTWEENGAIFTDVAYGGYIIITTGLIIAQCTGELAYAKKMENFFLVFGALLFIAAGSLELAALDSVQERLVDNAAILGVISLITGLLFILDLLLAGKRRKKTKVVTVKKVGYDKNVQTDDTKLMEVYRSSDMNGNAVQNGGLNGGYYPDPFPKMGSKKIPTNGIKILPTSPVMDESYRIPVTNSQNEYVGTISNPLNPPVYAPSELKTHEAKIRSTESFLRSEKGEFRRREEKGQVLIPPGYVLVPAGGFDLKSQTKPESRGSTPPGYAKIVVDEKKLQKASSAPEYVIIPVDRLQNGEARKLQSPTVTTTVKNHQGYYYAESPDPRGRSSDPPSDGDELYLRKGKYSPEYLQMDTSKNRKHSPISDDSSDGPKYRDHRSKGKTNRGYEDEVDFVSPFQRNSSHRSSRTTIPEKPGKSILRLEQKPANGGLSFPKDVHYDSLDSRKIAEDLRHLKEITKSDLKMDLEKENELLKEHLRKEKEEREKLKQELKIELLTKEEEMKKEIAELADRKKLEVRVSELEELKKKIESEERKKLEDEKDRRMSEKEVQYFGIADLKQSHKDSSPVSHPKMSDIEDYIRSHQTEGAKEINAKLKEKLISEQDKAKEDQELRKILEESFYFFDEEDKKKKRSEKSAPDLTHVYQKSIDSMRAKTPENRKWKETPSDESDETAYSQQTDEEYNKFWPEDKSTTPTSPRDPGYVLHLAQNWPDSKTPSPQDRFQFSSKKAQKFKQDLDYKMSQKSQLLDYEETQEDPDKVQGRRKGLLVRKVDFPEEPVTDIQRPATVAGSTSTWKKWLQPKPKLQPSKSMPN